MQPMLLTLPDGTTVLVRPITPEDKPLLSAGLRMLSPETAMRRFLSPKTSFSAAELRYLTEVDQVDHVALVAVDAHCGGLIAVARCVRVSDRHGRARDRGRRPVAADGPRNAARRAAGRAGVGHGIARFSGTMLATNRGAVRLMRGFGTHVDSDVIEFGRARDRRADPGQGAQRDGRSSSAASSTPTHHG